MVEAVVAQEPASGSRKAAREVALAASVTAKD